MFEMLRGPSHARRLAPFACCVLALIGVVGSALGGPVNPALQQGTFTLVEVNPGQFMIQTSNGSIVSFDSFNIATLEEVMVQFTDGDGGRMLNRINGDFGATQIDGSLMSNGVLYFVNPAGIFFGQGALVDVGGIYAAAGTMSDSDFNGGVNRFTDLTGAVENLGTITTVNPGAGRTGGVAALIGQTVANFGHIDVGDGVLALGSGDSVLLTQDMLNGRIMLTIAASADPLTGTGVGVENGASGELVANGGQIVLGAGDFYAMAIRNEGMISGSGTQVTLAAAGGTVETTVSSVISTPDVGGAIDISSVGSVILDGDIDGESVDISGDSILLNLQDVSGSDIIFHDDILLGRTVTVIGDDHVVFDGRVDSAVALTPVPSAQFNSLFVLSPDITFGGDIGASSNLTILGDLRIQLPGTVTFDARDDATDTGASPTLVNTVFSMIFAGDVVIADEAATFTSARVDFGGRLDSAADGFNNLTLFSPRITLSDRVGAAGADVLSGPDESISTAFGALSLGLPGPGAANNTNIDTDLINAISLDIMNNAVFSESLIVNGFDPSDDSIGSVRFGQIVNTTSDSGAVDLVVNSPSTLFNGSVGALDVDTFFNTITTDANGVTTLNGTDMIAQTSIEFHDDVVIGSGDIFTPTVTTVLSAGDSVTFHGTIDSASGDANGLVVETVDTYFGGAIGAAGLGEDEVPSDGSITALGLFQTDEQGLTRIDTDTIIARDIDFDDDIRLEQDVVMVGRHLSLPGVGSVDFAGRVDSAESEFAELEIFSPNTQFHGLVGQLAPGTFLGRLITDADGVTVIDTSAITAFSELTFNDDLIIASDVMMLSGFDATFNGAIDSALTIVEVGEGEPPVDPIRYALNIDADRTTFNGAVGVTTPLTDLSVDRPWGVTSIGASDISADTMTFGNAVELSSNSTLTGDTVHFARDVNGNDGGEEQTRWDLTINADATFDRMVGNEHALGALVVDGAATLNGGLVDADLQEYRNSLTFDGDTILSAREQLVIRGGINGNGALMAIAEGDALLAGDITLGSLETVVQGTLVFDRASVTATGDVLLNDAVMLLEVPTVATIGAEGDLTITAANFVAGDGQRMSVVGDLVIDVGTGMATFGDLSALGVIDINAGAIGLRLREAGVIQRGDGSLASDMGLDIVAGGAINFSVAPTLIGAGLPGVQFSSGTGEPGVGGTFDGFIMHGNGGFLPSDLLAADGTFLDLRAEGATTTDLAQSFAEYLPQPSATGMEVPGVLIGGALRQRLASDLGIPARDLRANEARELLAGRAVYLDAPQPSMEGEGSSPQIAINRLSRLGAIGALQTYEQIRQFGSPGAARDLIAGAWTSYIESRGRDADPIGLDDFLAERGATRPRECMMLVGQLIREVEGMGFNSVEARMPIQHLITTFVPESMGGLVFDRALQGMD